MELRDYLIELYLKHGEREFVYNRRPLKNIGTADYVLYASYLTPAAIKLIKEGTE